MQIKATTTFGSSVEKEMDSLKEFIDYLTNDMGFDVEEIKTVERTDLE